jgi:RNA 2',3'-cyclic 3'-phosphodiesterase
MASTLRTFIGIRIPATDDLNDVLKTLGKMGKAIKPTAPDALHLTLKFLGETESGQVADIARHIQEAAAACRRLDTRLQGCGVFPDLARPRVIWAGLDPQEELDLLAMELDERLTPLGYPPESRGFHPHVTLARVRFRPPDDLHTLLTLQRDRDFGPASLNTVELIRSDAGPNGSIYTTLSASPMRP